MTSWKKYKFSEFADINPVVKLKANQEYSFIEMKDLNDGQRFVYPSGIRKLTGGARFEEGDILFARITPCLENGKIGQAKRLKDKVGFGSTEFLVFRGRKNISDSNFIYYLSRWDEVRRFAELNMVGTSGRQRVPKDVFDNLELTLPNLSTQKRIASILASLDDKIELNCCMNQTLEQLAATLFKRYFVDDIDLSESKEISILDIANLLSGGTPKTSMKQYWGGDVYWISAKDVTPNNGTFIIDSERKITKEGIINSNAKLLPAFSTVITARGTVGKICLLPFEMAISQSNYALKSKIDNVDFVLFQLVQYKIEELKQNSYGTVFDTITTNTLRDLKINLPSLNKIVELENKIKPLYFKILSNLNESKTLKQTRDYLLPKLLSGEIDLSTINQNELRYETVLS